MNGEARQRAQDIAVLRAAIEAGAPRLHGIASRSDGAQIAAEVLRLNDSVRAGAAGRIHGGSQPADFPAVLLANADTFGFGGAP